LPKYIYGWTISLIPMPSQPIGVPDPATSDEVTEGRPWWKVCCVGCCLGFVVLIVAIVVLVQAATGPGPKPVKSLPSDYPRALVFRPEEAAQILYYPGSSKGTVAKIVTAPLNWVAGLTAKSSASSTGVASAIDSRFHQIQGRDTVTITWQNLNASRDEVLRFYAGALKEEGIFSVKTTDPDGTSEIHMTAGDSNLEFDLLIEDNPDQAGIDLLTVRTDYAIPSTPAASR
jgi:hypothetical protein